MATTNEIEQEFISSPTADGLLKVYADLVAQGALSKLPALLDQVRPIQTRITLIQADADPRILEALSLDPNPQVREAVASHSKIGEEVCLRLAEDTRAVGQALRKNPNCNPVVRAALSNRFSAQENDALRSESLMEIAWQARRCSLSDAETMSLFQQWTGLKAKDLATSSEEDAHLVLEVLEAKLGKGPMPRKRRKRRKRK